MARAAGRIVRLTHHLRRARDLREDLDAVLAGALAAVDPRALVRRAVADLGADPSRTPSTARTPTTGAGGPTKATRESHVLVAAVGKASWGMLRGAFEELGPRIRRAVVVAPEEASADGLPPHRFFRGGHPFPDQGSVEGARAVLELVRGAGPAEEIVFLLSGGASALMALPPNEVSLEDLALTSRLLMEAGADIIELNTVRKHLDGVKGGGIARAAAPKHLWAGILSDVVGDRMDVIGSGPVSPDPTTFHDALEVVRSRIPDRVPASVLDHLEAGARGEIPDTPTDGDPCFRTVEAHIVGNAETAMAGAARAARDRGYDVREGSAAVTGEAREVGRALARIAARLFREVQSGSPVDVEFRPDSPVAHESSGRSGLSSGGSPRRSDALARRVCYLSAGETTVTVSGNGRGGPNQEVALAAALELDEGGGLPEGTPARRVGDRSSAPNVEEAPLLVASLGTDGIDGPTDAAGAIADPRTVPRARRAGISPEDALADNDSYSFFRALDDHIRTGPTGTNVMDLHVVLVGERPEPTAAS